MNNTTNNDVLVFAYNKGYRCDNEGNVLNPNGGAMNPSKNQGYFRFSVRITGCNGKRTPKSVKVHRLQAFQKFGTNMMYPGIQVRHLDGDSLNNHRDNIAIGTQSQNMMDIDPEERREHAAKGNRKHSDEFIVKIRREHSFGSSYKDLSVAYKIPKSTLSYYLSDTAKRTSYSNPKQAKASK